MPNELRKGERVAWKSHGGSAEGRVVKKVTERTQIKGHSVAASPDNPQYIVETGENKRAAHKPGTLKKI